jgi:hypothetical protein
MNSLEQKKIYVGCALAQAPDMYLEEIAKLKASLREEYEVLDFVGKVDGTPQDVYEHDIFCVTHADLFVAECTYPSTGLGVEIAEAYRNFIPTLAIAQEGVPVSRLIEGIPYEVFSFRRYREIEDVVEFVKEKFES